MQTIKVFVHDLKGNITDIEYDPELGVDTLFIQVQSLTESMDDLVLTEDGQCLADVQELSNGSPNIWRFPASFASADFCSSQAFADGMVIQPCYQVADTPIRLCSFCAGHMVDTSMLVYKPHALISFACGKDQARDFGLLREEGSAQALEMEKEILRRSPYSLFLQRKLCLSAMKEQMVPSGVPGSMVHTLSDESRRLRLEAENILMQRLEGVKKTYLNGENLSFQAAARDAIDYRCVLEEAMQWRRLQIEAGRPAAEDVAVIQGLLRWFKKHFFTWCSKPLCQNEDCPAQVSAGVCSPEGDEIAGSASRVEKYVCSQCSSITRFPRYNNPATLLRTRTGRCGEWANCFHLICRSLAIDCAYVMDFTDHVWVELFVPSLGRYVHADPCEMSLDTPMVYEKGWSKKLTYVLSASRHGLTDVTPRYTSNWGDVLLRRGSDGADTVWISGRLSPRRLLDQDLQAARFQQRTRRVTSGETIGRISGDEEWKSSRGEAGEGTCKSLGEKGFLIRVGAHDSSGWKQIPVPQEVVSVSPHPFNFQHDGWTDRFKVQLEPGELLVRRIDSAQGWGQDLVLFGALAGSTERGVVINVGSSDHNCKEVKIPPRVQNVASEPLNSQHDDWTDTFTVTLDAQRQVCSIRRTDCSDGWGQDLLLWGSFE
eukprot:GSChrysophyteH1.ASY1.ANO1.1569.1 assembled CDS